MEDIEKLLRRIEDLERAHALLKQKIFISCNRRQTSSHSWHCAKTRVHLTEANYYNVLQSIDETIHVADDEGRLVYRNPAWEKMYGYSEAESLGKDIVKLTVGSKDVDIAYSIKQEILKGVNHCGEFVVRNKKGERLHVFGSTKPLRDQNGKIIGVIGVSDFLDRLTEKSPESKVETQDTTVKSTQELSSMINCDPMILSPNVENTVKNGMSWPQKGKGTSFDSTTVHSCLHWYHSDQEHEYALKMISCMSGKQPTTTLGQLSSSFDKVYEIKWEDLMIRECIGKGSYWMLYHAVWYGSDVAIKLFPKQEYSHDFILSFRQEVSVMRRLRHPNILLFMGAVISPQHVCIVTEFLCRGSLFQLLHKRRVRFNMKHRVHMALDIALGMNYLHCCLPPIIHCGLTSANLRVNKNWTVKIGDFGMCRPKHETTEGIGSPEWMAPEVLRNEEADEKSDVYSYGVVLWEMTTEKIPWDGHTKTQVIKAVGFMNQRLDIPKDMDPQWASLIERCLCSEPESRPTFQEILDELKELQKSILLQSMTTRSANENMIRMGIQAHTQEVIMGVVSFSCG